MNVTKNEIDKLVSYCSDEILKSDIDRIVSKSLNVRVFEITDGIMAKDTRRVMTVLSELKDIKEAPMRILYTIFSAFDKMLYARLAEDDGMMYNDIISSLGVHPYAAKKYIAGARAFGRSFLIDRVCAIAEADFSIKQGITGDWDALENYIAECIYKNE